MNQSTSLFSLSKISISDLFVLRGKKYENQAEKTKVIRKLPNPEDAVGVDFEKKMEKSKISLGLNSNSYFLNNSSLCSDDAASSNKNKKFLYIGSTTESENTDSNQVNISDHRYDIKCISMHEKDASYLISEVRPEKGQFATRTKVRTKGIWDSIQENIKNIISSDE